MHVETPRDDRVSYLHPGLGFRPLHACSCAKAVAAFSSEPILATALEGKLRAYTQHTHTELADLEEEFARIRRQGFAECVQELEVGMCSVAVPVQIGEASPWLSLGATGSARLFTEAYRMRLGATLANISKTFAEILEHKASTVARNEPKAISSRVMWLTSWSPIIRQSTKLDATLSMQMMCESRLYCFVFLEPRKPGLVHRSKQSDQLSLEKLMQNQRDSVATSETSECAAALGLA